MHHRLSRYLWFVISTSAVIGVIVFAQANTTLVGIPCSPASVGNTPTPICVVKEVKDQDLVKFSWLLLTAVLIVDVALVAESMKTPRRSSKSRKRK